MTDVALLTGCLSAGVGYFDPSGNRTCAYGPVQLYPGIATRREQIILIMGPGYNQTEASHLNMQMCSLSIIWPQISKTTQHNFIFLFRLHLLFQYQIKSNQINNKKFSLKESTNELLSIFWDRMCLIFAVMQDMQVKEDSPWHLFNAGAELQILIKTSIFLTVEQEANVMPSRGAVSLD